MHAQRVPTMADSEHLRELCQEGYFAVDSLSNLTLIKKSEINSYVMVCCNTTNLAISYSKVIKTYYTFSSIYPVWQRSLSCVFPSNEKEKKTSAKSCLFVCFLLSSMHKLPPSSTKWILIFICSMVWTDADSY